MQRMRSDSQAPPMKLGAIRSNINKTESKARIMPVHKPINTVAGKQRQRNRSTSKEIDPIIIFIVGTLSPVTDLTLDTSKETGPIVIFIAESFLDISKLSFIRPQK